MPEPLPALQAASPASPLDASRLYRRCEMEELPFASTEELEPLAEHLGQDRAVEALEFGLQIPHSGYNIFLLGSTGVGKQDLLASLHGVVDLPEHAVQLAACSLDVLMNQLQSTPVSLRDG